MLQIHGQEGLRRRDFPKTSAVFIMLVDQLRQMQKIQEQIEKVSKKYETIGKQFNKGIEDRNKRGKPSNEVEEAWFEIVDFLKISIPKSALNIMKFYINRLVTNYNNIAQNFIKTATQLKDEDIPASVKKDIVDEVIRDYKILHGKVSDLSQKYGNLKYLTTMKENIEILEHLSDTLSKEVKNDKNQINRNQQNQTIQNLQNQQSIQTNQIQEETQINKKNKPLRFGYGNYSEEIEILPEIKETETKTRTAEMSFEKKTSKNTTLSQNSLNTEKNTKDKMGELNKRIFGNYKNGKDLVKLFIKGPKK